MGHTVMDALDTYLAVSDHERNWDPDEAGKATAVVRLSGTRRGARVFDLGAGQGWQALRLAADFRVVAIERERRLASELKRRAQLQQNREPFVITASNADVPVPDSTADMAMSVGSSLGFGSVEDDRAMFEELRRLLRPGARATIEAVSADGAAVLDPRTVCFPDGARVEYSPRFDVAGQILRERQTAVLHDGRRGTFGYRLRTYDPGDLLTLARQAGLIVHGVHGSLRGTRWAPPDPVVLVLRRPEPTCSVQMPASVAQSL